MDGQKLMYSSCLCLVRELIIVSINIVLLYGPQNSEIEIWTHKKIDIKTKAIKLYKATKEFFCAQHQVDSRPRENIRSNIVNVSPDLRYDDYVVLRYLIIEWSLFP